MHLRRIDPLHARRKSWTAPALIAVAIGLTAGRGVAQEKPQLLYGTSSNAAEAKPLPESLGFRPNVEHPIYFFVKNPTTMEAAYTVVVAGVSAEARVGAGKTEQVSFAKPAAPPPPAPGAPPPPADPKAAWTELKDTPPVLRVQLLEGAKEISASKVKFDLVPAANYLETPVVTFDVSDKPGENQLSIQVTAGAKFDGPPCVVQMVLPPEHAKGLLLPLSRDSDVRGTLTKKGDKVTLFAKNLRFQPGVKPTAVIYLTVDGYQHAFVYETELSPPKGTVNLRDSGETYRVVVDPFAPGGGKLTVHIEADDCRQPDDPIELALGKYEGGKFEKKVVKILPGCRDKKVRFSPTGKNGSMLFQIEVNDWAAELDTAGVLGKRVVRVRPDKPEDAPDVRKGETVVVLDGTPPEDVAFVDPPATAFQGVFVPFQAKGKDDESGIAEVVYFFGKAPADGKLPPTLDTYKATKDAKGIWSAKVPMPSDKKGPTLVSVQFVNGAGLAASASVNVTVLDPAAPKQPLPPGKIEGKILEGTSDNPRPQAKLEVLLLDEKGKEKDKTKTDDKGTFVFDNVEPGKYKVTAVKTASVTKAEQAVEVKSGETVKVEAKLFSAIK